MKTETIAFIPARGGSKSIPLKNVKSLCGRPLVYWNAEALQRTDGVDKIIVATDSDEIAGTVSGFGFSKVGIYRRNAENASDTASTESVMLEYIHATGLEPNVTFMLVQATSPLTDKEHFERGLALFRSGSCDSVLSCVRNKRFFWSEDGRSLNYDYRCRPRRQEFAGMLMENGAFYISSVGSILQSGNRLSGRIGVCEMPEWSAIEIDEPEDWIAMEALMRRHRIADAERGLSNVRLVATDVDGVLTDAGMYYTENGDEVKKFNTRDGMGFRLLRNAGIKTAILTSENTQIVERRSAKVAADFVRQGVKHGGKTAALREISSATGIPMSCIAYIGDDVNCIDALRNVGHPFCPADAHPAVKSEVPGCRVLDSAGGGGAFREVADAILAERTK